VPIQSVVPVTHIDVRVEPQQINIADDTGKYPSQINISNLSRMQRVIPFPMKFFPLEG
jgi:hypothetical protein